MAFASVGTRGSTSTKTAGQTLAMSPSANIPADALVVCSWTWDGGLSGGEVYDPMNERWACHDSAGNIWHSIYAGTENFTHQAAGMFISRVRNGLTTSDTVTIHCQITNRTCKAMALHEYSMAADKVWAVTDQLLGAAVITADPTPLTVGSLVSQEYLLLYVLGLRGPNTDTVTWDSDYSQTSVGTSGGADTSNGQLHYGHRIATLTTDTVNVDTNPDRSYSEGLVAVCECTPAAAFPVFPIIDDFNRANENPLDGGIWVPSGCIPTANFTGRVVSNQAGSGGSWLLESFPDCRTEVYATFPTFGSLGAGLLLNGLGCGNLSTRGGYEMAWLPFPQGKQTDYDRIEMGKAGFVAGFTGSERYLIGWVDATNGHKMGIQRDSHNHTLHYWIDEGGGWEEIGAVQYMAPIEDVNPIGQLGYEIFDSTTRMDDFGGGYKCFGFVPQYYRHTCGTS